MMKASLEMILLKLVCIAALDFVTKIYAKLCNKKTGGELS